MIDIAIGESKYRIASSVAELTVDQASKLFRSSGKVSPDFLLSVLTGIDTELLKRYDLRKFVHDVVPLLQMINDDTDGIDDSVRADRLCIGTETIPVITRPREDQFGKKLRLETIFEQAVKDDSLRVDVAAMVVANYYSDKIAKAFTDDEDQFRHCLRLARNMNVEDALSELKFFESFLTDAQKLEKHFSAKPEGIEVRAGIDIFNELKQFNSLYAVAKCYSITPDQASRMPYETAFVTLVRLSKETIFARRMREQIKSESK